MKIHKNCNVTYKTYFYLALLVQTSFWSVSQYKNKNRSKTALKKSDL